ncbi:hypothetical protein VTP01DRAFT_597 [Rhizomucor pusillus]|uniref:uncharacterized protein n=1 Tax=Rhizomucor pusillus TaxID=4840 RepID=UPI0037433E41
MFWSKQTFQAQDIPDLTNKVAIVTRSTGGIGKASALELARKNCTVIVAARNKTQAEATIEEIRKETKNDEVEFIEIDLCSLASVKKFADDFKSRHDKLHMLLNNADVLSTPFRLTEGGKCIEMQMATNHVAHYYLTMLLQPVLENSAPSRVIVVSSEAHRFLSFTGFNCDKLNDDKGYSAIWQYGYTKAANIMFTIELARPLKPKGLCQYTTPRNCEDINAAKARIYFGSFLVLLAYYGGGKDHCRYYVPVGHQSSPSSVVTSEKNIAKLWEWTEDILKVKAPDYEGSPV